MTRSIRSFLKYLFTGMTMIAITITSAYSADVTLRWDANIPAPEGYRVFAREGSQSYNYDNPHTLIGLKEGVTYSFVVRAFEGDLESLDSDEVSHTPPVVEPPPPPVDEGSSGGSSGGGDDGTDADSDGGDTNPTGEKEQDTADETVVSPTQPDASETQPSDPEAQPDDLESEPKGPELVIDGPVTISPAGDADLALTPDPAL
jgi:hypothetical protein